MPIIDADLAETIPSTLTASLFAANLVKQLSNKTSFLFDLLPE